MHPLSDACYRAGLLTQPGVIKGRQFHDPQVMPCTLTILSGLTPSSLGSQLSSVSLWQVLPWVFGHHVQQGTERGQEQGSNLPRAIWVTGSAAGSLTKQRFSFICTCFPIQQYSNPMNFSTCVTPAEMPILISWLYIP